MDSIFSEAEELLETPDTLPQGPWTLLRGLMTSKPFVPTLLPNSGYANAARQ